MTEPRVTLFTVPGSWLRALISISDASFVGGGLGDVPVQRDEAGVGGRPGRGHDPPGGEGEPARRPRRRPRRRAGRCAPASGCPPGVSEAIGARMRLRPRPAGPRAPTVRRPTGARRRPTGPSGPAAAWIDAALLQHDLGQAVRRPAARDARPSGCCRRSWPRRRRPASARRPAGVPIWRMRPRRDHADAVGEGRGVLEVVRHQQRRQAQLVQQAEQLRPHAGRGCGRRGPTAARRTAGRPGRSPARGRGRRAGARRPTAAAAARRPGGRCRTARAARRPAPPRRRPRSGARSCAGRGRTPGRRSPPRRSSGGRSIAPRAVEERPRRPA